MLTNKRAGFAAAIAAFALAAAAPAAFAQVANPPPFRVDVYTGTPQADPGDMPGNWSARQNVVDSQRYEQLVHTSPAFRAARIRKECGGLNDPEAYSDCVASFDQ